MPDGPLLSVRGLHKHYRTVHAVRGVDLDVQIGEVVCIIGPSGCGKSTLLRCINFLEKPDRGTVHINGSQVGVRHVKGRQRPDSQRNVNRMRSQIGMVFQQFNVWPHLTAIQNVVKPQVCVAGRPSVEAEHRAEALLDRVGLAEKAHCYPRELSGGQLQRVAIARALGMEPRLMLFDEPTSALDPELVAEVLGVMRELAEADVTMVVVTHELAFAAHVADRIIFMDGGRIVEQGPPVDLLERPRSDRLRQFVARVRYNRELSLDADE